VLKDRLGRHAGMKPGQLVLIEYRHRTTDRLTLRAARARRRPAARRGRIPL
jgi:hypothetical protein